MAIVLDGVTALLTYRDLPKEERGPRSLDLPLSSNPLWFMLAVFLQGVKYDRSTDEKRRRV